MTYASWRLKVWDQCEGSSSFRLNTIAEETALCSLYDTMANPIINVILIEDNPIQAALICANLAKVANVSFQVDHANCLKDGIAKLAAREYDAVLIDLMLPDSAGPETYRQAHFAAPHVPMIVLTGLEVEELGVEAVQAGAQDYLVKNVLGVNTLARSIRYAIERHRREQAEKKLQITQDELRVAKQIQERLFPSTAPELQGYDIAGSSVAAEMVGGDYFDYIEMLDGSLGLAIGDASGHGLGPALLMAEARACLRTLAQTYRDPGEILTLANRILSDEMLAGHMITLKLVRIDLRRNWLTYASAGHPTGYILNDFGEVRSQLESTSFPLGVLPESDVPSSAAIALEPNDTIILITDGLTSNGPADFDEELMLRLVRQNICESAQTTVDVLQDAVRKAAKGEQNLDDSTVIVAKVKSDSVMLAKSFSAELEFELN